MQTIKEHIIFRILTLVLVTTLLVPSIVKFSHVFTHNQHKIEICKGERRTHLHELDIDCKFFKFQLNNNFTPEVFKVDIFSVTEKQTQITSHYNFLSKYQRLHFSLRGPPSLI